LNSYVSSNVGFSAAGGKLVEPTPEIERDLAAELEKVAKQYGGGEGVDMTQFPTFKFKGK
jgi:F-type H+-transporting ATPase subunit 6